MSKKVEAINWNAINDMIDKATWEKLTEQFWLDTRIPVGDDLDDWQLLEDLEKTLFNHIFGGLTLLDTLQSSVGVKELLNDTVTMHEEAVLNNIIFMESVHAKSYSTIFSTFNTKSEIDGIFDWIHTNKYLQYKAKKIEEVYLTGTPLQKKAISVMLESFLFYSGFYTPLHYLGQAKMTNTAEVIKMIIRDETVHGTYIGYKFRLGMAKLPPEEQAELKEWVVNIAFDLWNNELAYTKEVYDPIGWTDDVNTFLEYNLNKALDNLGLDPLFQTTAKDVNPLVMNGLSTTTSNHDFFSQVGNGYLLGVVEPIKRTDFALLDSIVAEFDK